LHRIPAAGKPRDGPAGGSECRFPSAPFVMVGDSSPGRPGRPGRITDLRSVEPNMPRFLLLARDDGTAFADLSPQEAEAVIGRYIAWSERLRRLGHLASSDKLRDDEGRTLRKSRDQLVITDGPYVEVKEVVGGFWLLDAASYDQAVALASESPHLDFGSLELRQIHELDRP
jgi:hypothetical protein